MLTEIKERTDVYKNDFEHFLACTDEKEVLLREINRVIADKKPQSLLDIGAGNGLLSIPISKLVPIYAAVEEKESFIKKLEKAGLKVYPGSYPFPIKETFDFILISHAISYKKDRYEAFLNEAWKVLNDKGTILIVTYRGQEDDWSDLMDALGKSPEDYNRIGFNNMIEFLYSLSDVTIRKVTTLVRTKTEDELIEALSFVASDGKPDRKAEFLKHSRTLKKILQSRYKDEKGYFFPFQHFFLLITKNKRA